jgi:hypothetical protein
MKSKKGEKGQVPQAPILSAPVNPSMSAPQVNPSLEIPPSDPLVNKGSLNNEQSDMPKGLNRNDMIVIVTGDPERVANVQRLIWSLTGMLVVVVGSASAIVIFAAHNRYAGEVGLATATIAGITSILARIRLRKKRDSG